MTTPLPYADAETQIQTHDGLFLTARLHGPSDLSECKQIALILPGSGNVDYDGDISSPLTGFGLPGQPEPKLSLQLATSLGQIGIPSLRYSKRGFEDPARLPEQTPEPLLQDLLAAWTTLGALAPHAEKSIIGFSEGALLAAHAAARGHLPACQSLHLLGLPTRSIDDVLDFQFRQCPQQLLKKQATPDGVVPPAALDQLWEGVLPGLMILGSLEAANWRTQARALGKDETSGLSTTVDLPKIYDQLWTTVQALLALPQFASWYQGLKALPDVRAIAGAIEAPVYLYQGQNDAQVSAEWSRMDAANFSSLKAYRELQGLGHAFAPHLGTFGEIKSSGPLSPVVLSSIQEAFLNRVHPT